MVAAKFAPKSGFGTILKVLKSRFHCSSDSTTTTHVVVAVRVNEGIFIVAYQSISHRVLSMKLLYTLTGTPDARTNVVY